MSQSPVMLHFAQDLASAERIAQAAGMASAPIDSHRFPDGELKLTLPVDASGQLPEHLPEHVVLLRTLDNPNEKLVELLLVARTARTLGARHVTLVAPYLAYMRQDIAFHSGEVVSQRVVGRFLADLFDAVITVDPHLHRVATLQEAVPVPQAIVLSGAPLLADLIATQLTRPLLIGPDEESAQWIAQAAERYGFDHGVCHKVRHGDREVQIALPTLDVQGRSVVVLDDVAGATRLLLAAGAATVDVAVTHALFAGDALKVIKDAGVDRVWSTDCITHPSNAVSMAETIASALLALHD